MGRQRKPSIEEKIVVGLMKGIGAILTLPFRLFQKSPGSHQNLTKATHLDPSLIKARWGEIEQLMQLSGSSHFRQAILQADSLFDYTLKAKGLLGGTMGERLQNARDLMSPDIYQDVWNAHKVRNRLAHEIDAEVMSWEAREAVEQFKNGLLALNAL